MGWASGVSLIARSRASESSMVMLLETGTPKTLTVSCRWISAMTRDLRSCSKRLMTSVRAAARRLGPK